MERGLWRVSRFEQSALALVSGEGGIREKTLARTIVILHGIQKKAGHLSRKDVKTADRRAGEIADYYRESHK